MFDANIPISASIQIGEASGSTDAGLLTGSLVVSSFSTTANADGEWDWSLDGTFSSAVTYTPSGS
jgi:hypothetical protein